MNAHQLLFLHFPFKPLNIFITEKEVTVSYLVIRCSCGITVTDAGKGEITPPSHSAHMVWEGRVPHPAPSVRVPGLSQGPCHISWLGCLIQEWACYSFKAGSR